MRASSPWTTRSCRVLVTLLLATRVSIFAYSASPAKSSMFKTILSPVNYRRRDRDEEDSGSAELEALKVLLPTLVSKSPIPAAESTGSDAAPRSSLFRRRATEDTSNSVKSTPNGNGNALSSLNPSDATFSSTAYTAASAAHQQQQQQQQGSPSSIISNTTAAWDVLRGGAVAGPNLLVATFLRFANFVGQTKARCFLLLLVSVFIESYATTLSKQAKDTGNALLFVRACFVYIMW